MIRFSRYCRVQKTWSLAASISSAATFSIAGPTAASPMRGAGAS